MEKIDRRKFLQSTGLVTAGTLINPFTAYGSGRPKIRLALVGTLVAGELACLEPL